MDSGFGYVVILLLPFLLLVFMMYTQRKRAQQIQALQAALVIGDEVVTPSGLHRTAAHLDRPPVTLDTANRAPRPYDPRSPSSPAPQVP